MCAVLDMCECVKFVTFSFLLGMFIFCFVFCFLIRLCLSVPMFVLKIVSLWFSKDCVKNNVLFMHLF